MSTIREVTIDDLPHDMRRWFNDMVRDRAQIGYKDHSHVIEGIFSVVWEVAYIPGRAREGRVGERGHNNDEEGNGIEHEELQQEGLQQEGHLDDTVGMRVDSEDDVIRAHDAKYIIMVQDAINSLSLPASYKAWLNRMITERFQSGYNISDHVVEGMQWAVSEACYVAGDYPEDSDADDELVTDEASGAGHALVAAEDSDEVMGSDEEGGVNEAKVSMLPQYVLGVLRHIEQPNGPSPSWGMWTRMSRRFLITKMRPIGGGPHTQTPLTGLFSIAG